MDAAAPGPVELHGHCTIGLAPLAYVEGVHAGSRTVHTAVGPVANGTSHPYCANTVRNLEADGLSRDLDLEAVAEVSEHFADLARARVCRSARRSSTTPPTTATTSPAAW